MTLRGLSLFVAAAPALGAGAPEEPGSSGPPTPYPILFVTQVPVPADYTTTLATFGNHLADPARAGRGGDLWIRYPSGVLRNLTEAAGWGESGLQGPDSIAVRDPCVHWDGRKAIFSMVVGAPAQYQQVPWRWQLYEIEGLAPQDTPVITKVAHQPPFDNVAPCYAGDDRVLFVSDRPRNGAPHLYPQLDEYEEAPANSGLWSLDPASGVLELLDHSPSGAFDPSLDRFGRVVYTRWDHLQRDQQADSKYMGGNDYGTFNYLDESPGSPALDSDLELFPEPRRKWIQYVDGHPGYSGPLRGWTANTFGHDLNQFFPWTVNPDGTQHETLLHLGRHELSAYFPPSLEDDPNLIEFLGPTAYTRNPHPLRNALQLHEEPGGGVFLAVDAPEFGTHACGQVVRLPAPPGLSPDAFVVQHLTHPDTADATDTPSPEHSGLYRQPARLSDGSWIAVHTGETRADENEGTRAFPRSRYDLRLKLLAPAGAYLAGGTPLTSGIVKSVRYYDPDVLVHHDGELWELDPVEVRPRERPPLLSARLERPERTVLAQEGVTVEALTDYLRQRGLALVVARNVTTRDRNDRQQPFNLRVAGGGTETIAESGKVYDVAHLQIFQGDQVRGLTFGGSLPIDGRRVLAQPLHEPAADNPPLPGAPRGSVAIARDGSAAALVPARRALSWQLVDPAGEPVVRERYWLTLQPGEIRACASCHGPSTADQLHRPAPENPPEALRELVRYLQGKGAL